MELQPITYDEACDFARRHQCDPFPAQGWKFGIAVNDGEKIAGVITVGRPSAYYQDDGRTLEVTLCCTDGTKNADSVLYRAALQATKALGYKRLMTYALVSESGRFVEETGEDISNHSRVSPEERATLDSILTFPKQNAAGDSDSDIEQLQVQLKRAKRLFEKIGCRDWVRDVTDALEKIDKDDFGFLEDLWLKFARDVDHLVLIAPRLHDPPLTEEEADALNGELADVANATFSALDKLKDTRSSLMADLV